MRLNSARASRVLRFIYLLCLFIIIFDIIVLNIDGSWGGLTKLSPFAILVILVLIYRGLPQFVYDSDGEVLNFTTREPSLTFLGSRFIKHIEFPKRKLDRYKVSSYPLRRRLTLYIRSKENHLVRQTISISYLNKKELRDLKRSLDRVVSNNSKKKHARST
jgi:hypothetical protein